jgi:two-component system sensor histidine kinase/response regulator
MFRRYGRLSARPTGGEPSTGLGLSIVRKLVQLMNGDLVCESNEGQGAAFRFRLPRPAPK